MKLTRGIIELVSNQSKYIMSVGNIYDLNNEILDLIDFKDKQKILGATIDNKFNICYNFDLNNGKSIFGYISTIIDSNNLKIQIINNFEGWNINSFSCEDTSVDALLIKKSEINRIVPASF